MASTMLHLSGRQRPLLQSKEPRLSTGLLFNPRGSGRVRR